MVWICPFEKTCTEKGYCSICQEDKIMKKYKLYDAHGDTTPLGEILRCHKCGMLFKQLDDYSFVPGCDCHNIKIRVSVG